jgi:hypothetical protein
LRVTAIATLGLILAAAAGGCGTMSNLGGQEIWLMAPQPRRETEAFGGVQNDVRWMARGLPPNEVGPLCIAAAALDMPLSLAGDIITLPYTVPYTISHRRQQVDVNASMQKQPSAQEGWDRPFTLDPPSSVTPDRVHGGIGPGF